MITLRIIIHELEKHGIACQVHGDVSKEYKDSRPFSDAESYEDILYIVDGNTLIDTSSLGKFDFVYLTHDEGITNSSSVLTLVTDKDILYVTSVMSDVFFCYRNWESRMDSILIQGGNIQDLLDVSSQLIKNNTVVVDPALRLLAYTKDVPCDDPVTVELIKHGYHTEENIRQFKLHKRFQPWATQDGLIINDSHQICKYTTVVKSFKTKNSYSIIVIMMCNQVKEPEDFLLDTLAILLKRIEVYALKEYPADKPSGNTVDTFLRDLIENKVFHETTIVERSQFVGIPFKSSFCLFYIDLGENPNYPIARLLSQVAKNVAPAKTLSYDDAIIVLCFNCQRNSCGHTCARGTCVSEKKTITARLTEILSEYGLSCGRSSMFYKLSDTHIAFLQAREAASLQHVSLRGEDELSSSEGQKVQIASFDNHYLAFMIDRSSVDGEDLIAATSAQRLLHQIKDYDDEHNTDNFFFLHQYLLHERRASVVADILHMHRNNVKYRIDRIEELFDIQCDNADLRLELLFAYEIFSIGSASVYE